MNRQLTAAAVQDYIDAPPAVRKPFDKQAKLLLENLRHPSLRAKKYDESRNIWQARVNRDWRFYFVITGDTYLILNIVPHPK
jgi:mRNA interferase RelE/StbE